MKAKSKAIKLEDAASAEAATPSAQDVERARELVATASPLLARMLDAKPHDAATKGD